MRAYFFGNMYLSSIQQGIQAAHVVAEMSVQYYCSMDGGDPIGEPFHEWATHHKTMILLNGGYSETIRELSWFFDHPENPYPWANFHEGEDALDGALTSVGIILPEKIYEGASELRSSPSILPSQTLLEEGTITFDRGTEKEYTEEYTKWEADLMGKLNKFGLAK